MKLFQLCTCCLLNYAVRSFSANMPEVGEPVMVLSGKYEGNKATIESKAGKTAKLNVNGSITGNIPLGQVIAKGDTVKSTSGKYEGKFGTVSDITAKCVKLIIDGTETGSVPWDSISNSISKRHTCGMAKPKTDSVSKSSKSETAKPEPPQAEKGAEPVMVLSGKYAGSMATIESKAGKTAKLHINGDTTGNIPLRQLIAKGDTVKSTSGKYEGKFGIVSDITAKCVRLTIDGTETGSVPWDSISKD